MKETYFSSSFLPNLSFLLMASTSRARALKHDDEAPVLESRDQWLLSRILLDSFSVRELVSRALPTERAEGNDDTPLSEFLHQTIFPNHAQGEGLKTNHPSLLSMRIQRNEAASVDIRFESKIQSTRIYKKCAGCEKQIRYLVRCIVKEGCGCFP